MATMTRRRIAQFEILEPIGRGGMGVVYRARDTQLNRPVAIKVLPPSFSTHPDRRSRFLREARAAANLNHPNIATVYQFGAALVEDGDLVTPPPGREEGEEVEILFLAMELIPGDDLHALLEAGPLPVERALDYGLQIAQGLEAAHRAGVTHRDLKPKNVRITPDGQVKILDFGLAKVQGPELPAAVGEESIFETTQGMVLGTPPYMAPEQLRGEVVDARADLYALGMVLFQMLAGRLPYPSKNLLDYAKALASAEGPPSLMETRSRVLEDLGAPEVTAQVTGEHEAIVRRLLEQEPEARYASAQEVIEALKATSGWESGVTHPRAPTPTAAYSRDTDVTLVQPSRTDLSEGRRWLPSSESRGWTAFGMVAVLALVVWVVMALMRTDADTGPIQTVVLPFEDQSGQPDLGAALIARMIRGLEGELVRLDEVEIISHREAVPLLARGMRYTEIAEELGADCLVQGTLLPEERLNVQLLEGEGAKLHWNFTFSLAAGRGDFDSESAMLRLVASVVELWRGVRGSLAAEHFRERGQTTAGDIDALEGDLETATYLIRQALEINPADADAHAALAQVYYQLLRQTGEEVYLAPVLEHADRALALNPDQVQAHLARGQYLRYAQRFEESIEELRTAVVLAPASDRALFELSASLYRAGEAEAALQALEQALELRSDYWFYKNQLASYLIRIGRDPGRARRLLEEAVKSTGFQAGWPLNNWGVLEIEEGNYLEAAALLERLPRPLQDADFATNLGTAYFYLEDMEMAAKYFEQAVALGDDSGYFRNLGDVYLELGRREEALEQYQRAAERVRQESDTYPWRLPLYLAKAQRCAEALGEAAAVAEELRDSAWWNVAGVELAKTHALCADSRVALDLLESVQAEEPLTGLASEPEFESLTGEPRFVRLTRQAKARELTGTS